MNLRFSQGTLTIGSLFNTQWLKILFAVFGLLVCLGIGFFLATENYIFAFGIFSLLLAVAVFLFPYLGLLLFFALTYARPQDYVPGLMGKPVILMLMGLTISAWLVHVVVLRRREFVKAPQNILLLLFISLAAVSSARTWLIYAKDAFIELFKIFLTYLLIVNLINSQRKLSIALWLVFLGTIYIATLGVFQHYGIAPGIAGTTPSGNEGRVQGFGIFDNPNYLAYGVCLMTPFALNSFYYFRRWPLRLMLLSVVLGVFLPCIDFTGSRGGMLCMASTPMVSIFQDRRLKTAISGALIGIFFFLILINVVPRLTTVDDYKDDGSAMGRVDAWVGGFNMLKSSPLLGVGYRQFKENWVRDSHNSFVEVGSELGLIGLFIWLGLLYYSYKYLRAIIQTSVEGDSVSRRAYSKSLKATILAFCIGSCFASLGYYMLLFLFHSFAVAAGQVYLPEEKREEINRIRMKDLSIVAGIEFLVLCTWYVFPKI